MSYGALSRSTKQAIAIASAMSGIAENTGEGGMSNAQRDAAGHPHAPVLPRRSVALPRASRRRLQSPDRPAGGPFNASGLATLWAP